MLLCFSSIFCPPSSQFGGKSPIEEIDASQYIFYNDIPQDRFSFERLSFSFVILSFFNLHFGCVRSE